MPRRQGGPRHGAGGRTLRAALLLALAAGARADDAAAFHAKRLPAEYAGGLAEFSVVFTDRALNHMSAPFRTVMRDLNGMLTAAYGAERAVLIPGSGTFGMEAVARQFVAGKDAVVVRNGYFSYRWSDIFEQGAIPKNATVVKAKGDGKGLPEFAPPPLEEVAAAIKARKPAVVFAPQVETSTGIILDDAYVKELAALAHGAGALFVLDAVAAGTIWVDMRDLGVDVLVTAPQKGWSSHACAGVVMLGARALALLDTTTSTSMVLNLKKWNGVMEAYLSDSGPGHAYYTTMPTDCLRLFRDMARETEAMGWDLAKRRQWELGTEVRAMLAKYGFRSVAAGANAAPGVVVVHAPDAAMPAKLASAGLQVAGGVPLMLGEAPLTTFRVGLFGLDKLKDVAGTVARLEAGVAAALRGKGGEL